MKISKDFAKLLLALVLALSVSACKTGSGGGSANASVSISITSPTSLPSIDTTDTTMSLSGNAASQSGINKVTWSNDRGGQGVANGTESWQIAGISLNFGINEITITAEDNGGARGSESLSIYRESGEPGTATLFWRAPTARTNGAPLSNLGGYKILYGRMSGIYDYEIVLSNPGIVAFVVENLMPGNWYFTMTAYDSQGLESTASNEVVRAVL